MPNVDKIPDVQELTANGRVSFQDIENLGARLVSMLGTLKHLAHKPSGAKTPPVYNLAQLAALCGKTSDQMSRLLSKEQAAAGEASEKNRKFSLAEARSWVRQVGPARGRKPGQPGAVISVANFKGGVGKTVISMSLAQGLALKGNKVLCIDFDPQGSFTSLFGLTPTDMGPCETVMTLMMPRDMEGASDTLQGNIRETYFDGIDLIPGNHELQQAEFYLPVRQMNSTLPDSTEKDFEFYNLLNNALDLGLREEYDYIIIDTPPSLSYMTMNCFWASDGLLMPLPAEGLDFHSSAQFWQMLAEVATGARGKKDFAWVGVVPNMVDHTNMQAKQILSWMKMGYLGNMLSTEIPETAAVRVGGLKMETVYDISKYVGSKKTLIRARDAFDKLVDEVDYLTRINMWQASESVSKEEA